MNGNRKSAEKTWFCKTKERIHGDAKNDPESFGILEESDRKICVWDNTGLISREYTIYDPDRINLKFYEDRLIVSPSVSEAEYGFDYGKILQYLYEKHR